jgi:hypothetical protein
MSPKSVRDRLSPDQFRKYADDLDALTEGQRNTYLGSAALVAEIKDLFGGEAER